MDQAEPMVQNPFDLSSEIDSLTGATAQRDPITTISPIDDLMKEIADAAERVYQLDVPTPLDSIMLSSGHRLWLKREDRSQVRSYKWRGAYNKFAWLIERGYQGPFVAASAGNHAQGVALAASRLKQSVTLFMPRTTPMLKLQAVKKLGDDFIDVRLVGDYYDQAASAAKEFVVQHQGCYLHPFDDLQVVAGQATIGLEIDDQVQPDLVFLQIGGGGMAAGVSTVLRQRFPNARIIGVEAEGQHSMQRSRLAGTRVQLPYVTRFCDGTAVSIPGEINHLICHRQLDDIWLVSEQDICMAIEWLWNELRIIVEPSAAIGIAAVLAGESDLGFSNAMVKRQFESLKLGRQANILTILSGANVDFLTLSLIAKKGKLSPKQTRYYRFHIAERSGTLIGLLDQFMADINIIDFQYGKTDSEEAFPVIGVEADVEQLTQFESRLANLSIPYQIINDRITTDFRLIPFSPHLAQQPLFATIAFPDRPGALAEFMRAIVGKANVCYFNYSETGQDISPALMGFEFSSVQERDAFYAFLQSTEVEATMVDFA